MSRKILVQQIQPDPQGPVYGRVSDPIEFMNSQDYAHEHTELISRDLLMAGASEAVVGGFGYSLSGGLGLEIAEGHAVDPNGLSFQTLPVGESTDMTLDAADPALPRIDLIYATLETDADAEIEFRPYVRLRTQMELEEGVPQYAPEQFNQPTERHNRARVFVKKGVPDANPVAPIANSNEVPLFQVRVEAGAVNLTDPKVTDVRNLSRSLSAVWSYLDQLDTNFSEMVDDRVDGLLVDSTYFTKVYDDAGNFLTLDADLGAFDGRYVKGAGDTMTGTLVVRPATGSLPASGELKSLGVYSGAGFGNAEIFSVISVATSGSTSGATRGGGRLTFYGDRAGNASTHRFDWNTTVTGVRTGWRVDNGMDFHCDNLSAGWTPDAFVFKKSVGSISRIISVKDSANSRLMDVFDSGNVVIAGSLSKASGTFQIDHPLSPGERDLFHGFVESSEYMLVYRATVELKKGRATIDLAKETRMSPGTFTALTQDVEVVSVYSRGTARVEASDIVDEKIDLTSDDAIDRSKVTVVVMAARNDAFIKTVSNVDENGRLVPEQIKPELDLDGDGILDDRVEEVESSSEVGEADEVVGEVAGLRGFPRHADLYDVELPKRRVRKIMRKNSQGENRRGDNPKTEKKKRKKDSTDQAK